MNIYEYYSTAEDLNPWHYEDLNNSGVIKYHNKIGLRHREDGPAIIWAAGIEGWYLNGRRHRDDGPAIVTAYGHEEWWIHDRLHREDGPAIV